MSQAVLLMAHGAPENIDEVPEYVLRIRHGRPLDPKSMADIQDRYRQIGGSPLLEWTRRQADAVWNALRKQGSSWGGVYFGMRYSEPYIRDTVAQMKKDGVTSIMGVCMAPQFSKLTIGAYRKSLDDAMSRLEPEPIPYRLVKSYAQHPGLIRAFGARLEDVLRTCPEAPVIFTAHSLPERVLQEGDPYDSEVKATARMVAEHCHVKDWRFAYQSQGMTSEKWLGPTVESVLGEVALQEARDVVIAPIGFVCDHVEILYDVDILFREYAAQKSLRLHRMPSLNDSKEFIELLVQLVQEEGDRSEL